MPTATVNVVDFTTTGPVPAEAYAVVERAVPDVSGATVVSTAPQVIRLTAGTGTFDFDADVPYKVRLHGVDGFEDPWWFQHVADATAAELYRAHQIDPTSLAPLPTYTLYSEQLAALEAQLTAILTGAPGDLDSFFEAATRFGLDEATVTALQALVAGKAPLASPALTGTPTAPTVAGATDSSTKLATTAFVQAVATALGTSVAATSATLWKPSTAYAAGQAVVNPAGFVVTALANFTSGASYSAANWSDPAAATYSPLKTYRVVVSVGQSNEVGQANDSISGYDAVADPRVLMWNGTAIVPATLPLYWPHETASTLGHTYLVAQALAARTSDTIVIVPTAMSGTSFEGPTVNPGTYSSTWKKGLAAATGGFQLYTEAVAAATAAWNAIKALGNAKPVLEFIICGTLGESDGSMGVAQATFQTDLDTFISNLRTDLPGASTTTPFLLGPMVPEGAVSGRVAIQAAHVDTPRRILNTAYFPGPANAYRSVSGVPDTTHFNMAGQRYLASQFTAALVRARANQLGSPALAPTNVQVSISGTTATITWDAPDARVTGYVVQVQGAGGSGYVTQTRTATDLTQTQTLTGVTAGTVFQVQIASVNEGGQSPFTTPVNAAAISVPTPAIVQATNTSATGSWASNPLAYAYRLDYKLSSSSTWTLGTPTAALTTTITGLTAASYDYELTVFTPFGTSTGSVVTATQVAQPLSGLTATVFRAVGLRKILSSATGNIVRVRRSSDSTEQDFGFLAGGGLDVASITTFCGSGDGYVSALYDQTGTGNHYTQATAAAQPKLVSAGAILTLNGKPAMVFDGATSFLQSTVVGAYAAGATTLAMVAKGTPAATTVVWAETSSSSDTPYYNPALSNRSDGRLDGRIRNDAGTNLTVVDATGYLPSAFTATPAQATVIDSGTALTFRVNAAQVGTRTYTRTGTLTLNRSAIGAFSRTANTGFAAIQLGELVEVRAAVGTTDQNAIESNQKTYYGTP